MLEVKATAKYIRTSAQKAGLVLDLIRGKKAADALAILRFTKKSVARDIEKTLRSAIANAVHVADKNQKRRLDEDDLVVSACYADQGPTQKRVRPAPMGRAYQVLKRTAHLTVRGGGEGEVSRWVRKSIPSGSGSVSTRPGAAAGTPRRSTRTSSTRTSPSRRTSRSASPTPGVSRVDIERAANKLKISIFTSRPGIIIGRKGQEVDKLKQEIQKKTGKEVFINIQEILKPELDAQLVSESVALQLEKRIAFRRAMRKAVDAALRFGAKGIKVRVSGRLNGAEIARSEWYLHGQLPAPHPARRHRLRLPRGEDRASARSA